MLMVLVSLIFIITSFSTRTPLDSALTSPLRLPTATDTAPALVVHLSSACSHIYDGRSRGSSIWKWSPPFHARSRYEDASVPLLPPEMSSSTFRWVLKASSNTPAWLPASKQQY